MRQSVKNTTLLAGNATFTSAWYSTSQNEQSQFNFVSASVYASHASASSGFVIEQTDSVIDVNGTETNANLTSTATSSSVSATTLTSITAIITRQHWRIKYTNGATLQTSFELTANVTNNSIVASGGGGTTDINVKQVGGVTSDIGVGAAGTGTLRVAVSSDSIVLTDKVATGNITSASGGTSTVQIALAGYAGACYAVTGSASATLIPEYSIDGGTTWRTIFVYDPITANTATNTASISAASNTYGIFPILSGMTHVRLRCSAYTSGTAAITLKATVASSALCYINTASGVPQLITGSPNGLNVGINASSNAAADALANGSVQSTGQGNIVTTNAPLLFNGTTWDRERTASLANNIVSSTLTARNSIGVALFEKGSRFSVVSAPVAGTVASASIASEASVRHICDSIAFSGSSSGAVTAVALTLVVRDGATGAGTIIFELTIACITAAAAGVQVIPPFAITGLNLVGSTATAMTLEFSAGVSNVTQACTLIGYNVN